MMNSDSQHEFVQVPIGLVDFDNRQPRRAIGDLQDFAADIRERGILQPIVVRRMADRFQLVIGERRIRAARMAGQETVPAIVRDDLVTQTDVLMGQALENLQREQLSQVDMAYLLNRIINETGMRMSALPDYLALRGFPRYARSTLSNMLRLLKLPAEDRDAIRTGAMTYTHGRAILAAKTPDAAEACRTHIKCGATAKQAREVATGVRNESILGVDTEYLAEKIALLRRILKITPEGDAKFLLTLIVGDYELIAKRHPA